MESAAMVNCAHTLVRAMKDELAETGTVGPTFILLLDGGCDFIAYDPALLNSAAGRAALAESLRLKAIRVGAQGVLIGMDSFALSLIWKRSRREMKSLYGSEAISVILQTPSFRVLLQQLYTRGESNSAVFGDLLSIDSREDDGGLIVFTGLFAVFNPWAAGRT